MSGARLPGSATWRDGVPVERTEQEWLALVPGFLGVGFAIDVPAAPAAVEHAAAAARAVADLADAAYDPAPWAALAGAVPAGAGPVRVSGGWERHLVRGLGGPWTRVDALPAPAPGAERRGPALVLPWPWAAGSPAAGLPTLSRLAQAQAERWLAARGAVLGLWTDADGTVVASTAGTPWLRTPAGGWTQPAGGAWRGWLPTDLAARHGVRPARLEAAALAEATALCAVDDLGATTLATSLAGRPLAPDAPPGAPPGVPRLSRRRSRPPRTPRG